MLMLTGSCARGHTGRMTGSVTQLAVYAVLLLLPNVSVVLSQVYRPESPVEFNIWTGANESWFNYPEAFEPSNYSIPLIQAKPNVGIAISGGGFRAATLGLGYLRALYLLNITSSAKYISSNSGGSWLVATYSFQDKFDLPTYFGPYKPPSQLQLSDIKQANNTEGNFGKVIADAGILIPGAVGAVQNVAAALAPGAQPGVGAWSAAVGSAFLQPYDLNADASTVTAVGTSGPVHQQALQQLDSAAVQVYKFNAAGKGGTVQDQRPYPMMLGSILRQNTPLGFYPMEFTPLYFGCPSFFNDTDPPLGGGFVDPQGFNTPPPDPEPSIPEPIQQSFADTADRLAGADNGTLLTPGTNISTTNSSQARRLMSLLPLTARATPEFLVPLKMLMGISSSFITNMYTPSRRITRELTGTEVLRYWSPISFIGQELAFGDGGSVDNIAITPLLRRRVTKIIAAVAASQNISASPTAADWAGYQYDIAGLFGALPPTHPAYSDNNTIVGTPVDLFNRKTQVFPESGYEELFTALKNSTASGGPTYHLATYEVLTNEYQAVFGGWKVEVLWVVNQQQTAWEDALPQDTAAALADARQQQQGQQGGIAGVLNTAARAAETALSQLGVEGATSGLNDFPFTDTGKANYSPELTALLNQMATWQMLNLQPQLQRLLQGTNVTLADVSTETRTPPRASAAGTTGTAAMNDIMASSATSAASIATPAAAGSLVGYMVVLLLLSLGHLLW